MPLIPSAWLPSVKMDRVIAHWTAGGHKATEFDRGHYHILIEADGKLVKGKPSIAANVSPVKPGYAAHALNANSGSIGVSLCCMAGATESPFRAGNSPMTQRQWDAMTVVLRELCAKYSIPVTPRTVLSHAEVHSNLGIAQRGKWDFTRIAFMPGIVGSKACGDAMRAAVAGGTPIDTSPPEGTVNTDGLNLRSETTFTNNIVAVLPIQQRVAVTGRDRDWLRIWCRLEDGNEKVGWVVSKYITLD